MTERRDHSAAAEFVPALISVVLPIHNRVQYLEEAISSVLRQSYPHREVIAVNDGSNLNVEPWVRPDSDRVRLIHQKNGGLPSARNAGARIARGEYLLFLDDDDALEPAALALLLRGLNDGGTAWSAGRFQFMNAQGALLSKQHGGRFQSGDTYASMLQHNQFGAPCSVLLTRQLFRSVGGFDETLPACEDYDLWLRIARDTPLAAVEHSVARYRLHDTNMSLNYRLMYDSRLRVLQKHRPCVRAGFEPLLDEAEAALRFDYADGLYMQDHFAEARHQWRMSTSLRPQPRRRMLPRYLKSYLPRAILHGLRRLRGASPRPDGHYVNHPLLRRD
jgi:glycosyltransferase involved in cell wall biosynthesis